MQASAFAATRLRRTTFAWYRGELAWLAWSGVDRLLRIRLPSRNASCRSPI